MNDDLVGIGGLLGCIVLLVLYALAIGAKTKQQPSKPLKPIQPRSTPKTPDSNVVNLTYRRHLRDVMEWSAKGPKRPDPAIIKTDPDFWVKYREWWYYYD
jgi:hypothetical protein